MLKLRLPKKGQGKHFILLLANKSRRKFTYEKDTDSSKKCIWTKQIPIQTLSYEFPFFGMSPPKKNKQQKPNVA